MVKKITKIILWFFVSIVGLLLLLSVLVYIPAVQNFVKNKVSAYVSQNMEMRLDIERFRLKLPLKLIIDNTTLVTAQGDTLIGFRRFEIGVQALPLLIGQVKVGQLNLLGARVNYSDSVSNISIRGNLGTLAIHGAGIELKEQDVDIRRIEIGDATIDMSLGESNAVDTATTQMLWRIAARQIDINKVRLGVNAAPQIMILNVDLDNGRINDLTADLGRQEIGAELIKLTKGRYEFLTDTLTVEQSQPKPLVGEAAQPSVPWTIRITSVELADNAFDYGIIHGQPAVGFDPEHIGLTGINVRIDSIYNRATDISAMIRSLAAKERSGLEIVSTQGRLSVDSSGIALYAFDMRTSNSRIEAAAVAGAGIMEMNNSSSLDLQLNASVGSADIFILYPLTPATHNMLRGRAFTLDCDIAGTLGSIDIKKLTASMPGALVFNAHGKVRSITNSDNMAGEVRFDGDFRDISFVKDFIADTTFGNRIGFPHRLAMNGMVSFAKNNYTIPALAIVADSGRMDINGYLDLAGQRYSANLTAQNFPLHAFLPKDSLGLLAMQLSVSGSGFDPMANGATAKAEVNIERFDIKKNALGDIVLDAQLTDHILEVGLTSSNPNLDMDIDINGRLERDVYSAKLGANIRKVDAMALGFSQTPMAISGVLDADVGMTTDSTSYSAQIVLDSTTLTFGALHQRLAHTTVVAAADNNNIALSVRSGDLALDFDSDVGVDSMITSLRAVAEVAQKQMEERNIDMQQVQSALPSLRLNASAENNNILHAFLATQGVSFKRITAATTTNNSQPLSARLHIESLHTGSLTLDTLNVGLKRQGDSLGYFVRLANRPGNIDQMAMIMIYGAAAGNKASANFIQNDRQKRTGFRFGIEAELQESAIQARIYPYNPVLGYGNWTANENNYLRYQFDKSIYADMRLDGENQHFHITSGNFGRIERGAVRIDIAGIDIAQVLELLPSPPAVAGILNTDLMVGYDKDMLAMKGRVGVDKLGYNGNAVGDVALDVALESDSEPRRLLDVKMSVDGSTALTAKGSLALSESGAMNIVAEIPSLPLKVANAFLPEDTALLDGSMNGRITVMGTMAQMDINGDIGFDKGQLKVSMLGTSFGVSSDRITVHNSKLDFNDFGLIAPNNQKFAINGDVDMRNFSRMTADLLLSATDFRAVNSTWTGRSQVYGRADLDMNITARGPMDALMIRGDVKLLRTTDVTYTMRDSPLEVKDAKQDIVTFVSFADTAALAARDSITKPVRPFGMDMLVSVNIDQGVRATVNLSEEGNDRIELIGEGELTYSMNVEGDTRFTGRYELSGGTVVYNPPVISQKKFSIGTDSYVEWTGDMLDPAFNIKATENLRTTVTMEDGSTSNVNFNIIIKIDNTLQNMAIMFDLAAPNDLTIQNQLSSLTQEQRSQQAMALLVYNTYTGPGTTAKVDSNNPMNAFIEKELNQWARNNLKGVNVSFGVNSADNMDGGQHTDYSYKVSKNLFNDRVKVIIGGSLNSEANTGQNLQENLVDDISMEYRLTDKDNMYIKLYQYNTQESILEGEVTETGGGFLVRRKMNKLKELFRLSRGDKREMRQRKRENALKSSGDKE